MDLTVMTYNIRMATFHPLGLEAVARVIEGQQPDIVGLQEINVYGYPTGPVDQPKWLADRLGLHSAFGLVREFPEMVIAGRRGATGNALLSRFPVREMSVHELPKLPDTPYRAAVLGCILQTPAGPLNVFITHWAIELVPLSPQAADTVQIARTWRAGSPVVLVGDLNALPESGSIAALRASFVDAFEATAAPIDRRTSYPSGVYGSTNPNGWSGALDYIFVSSPMQVVSCQVAYDEGQASDHNPVVARIRL